MAEPGIFTDLYNGYNATLINGSTAAANALLNAVAPELAAALSLFVIVNGVLVFLEKLPWNSAVLNCVRAIVVANLLTVGLYNQWVETMFLTTIPNWIAGTIGGAPVGVGVAGQFDALRAAVNHNAAVLLAANAGYTPAMIANRLSISLAAEFSVGALWLSFVIDFLAECLMGDVAPIGAVVLLAYLFNNTRHWAERWIGKLVALALLELLVAIELKIVLAQYQTEMAKVEGLSGSGMDATEAISMLWSLGWIFLFGAVVMVGLPAIAAAIGGSHVSNVVVMHINMASSAIGRLATTQAVSKAATGAAAATARGAKTAAAGNRSLTVG
ncbi:MAG: type secretion system protein VirB6 [Acetobacteraceae bacterium]|nr:type secretion system protein VirB6 [Acetobacteraceae bacterium]